MAASQEQKLDYLLKKIGYVSSKTGIAEDENTLSGTKKAPFAEPIPSPLVVPSTNIWADSSSIPSTPPGADTSYVQVYLAGSSGHRMTVDSTVSGNRTFIAYSTYNNTSTDILGDWIDPSFGSDYVIKVYKGDPNSGGVLLSAAGTASNDTWFFDYSSGVLNFNGSQVPSGVTSSNIYIVGYRYIGNKGAASPVDVKWFDTAVGIWTSSSVGIGTTNATSTLTVDGTLNVSGVSTFVGDVSFGSTVTFGDDDRLRFGDNQDLQIYSNGSNAFIKETIGSGSLYIDATNLVFREATGSKKYAQFNSNGSVELYHDNSPKFETTGVGVSIVNGTSDTATIYGPSNLIIDPMPVGVGTTSGIVRIKGDLYVDGTTTEINSTTLTIDDLNVVVASGATNGLIADGAGLSVAGAGATIKYNYNSGSEQWVFNKAPYYNTDRLLTTADEGSGNGIDADTLDGEEGTYYLDYSNFVGIATDSDKLDGQQGTYYLDYANFSGIATDSDKLDGQEGSYYLDTSSTAQTKLGDLTLSRGSNTSALTRKLVIGGARNSAANDFATLQFKNYDSNSGSVDYVAAEIKGRVPSAANNGGELVFLTAADGATSQTERVRIDSSGNLGIGIDNPAAKLDINPGYGTTYTGIFTGTDAYNPTTGEIRIGSDSVGAANTGDYVGLRFSIIGNGSGNGNAGIFAVREQAEGNGKTSLAFATRNWGGNSNLTEKVRITSSGDVGIGTTNPSDKLHVQGDIRIDNPSSDTEIKFGTDTDNVRLFRGNASHDLYLLQGTSSNDGLYLGSAGNVYVSIDTNNNDNDTKAFIIQKNATKSGTELARFTESGRLGIGTDSPDQELHVMGQVKISASDYARVEYARNNANLWSAGLRDTDDFIVYRESGSGNVIFQHGDVGIGLTNPTAKLDIVNDATNDEEVLRVRGYHGNSGSVQGITHVGLGYWSSGTYSPARITVQESTTGSYNANLLFSTRSSSSDAAPTERMRISYDGNIGIGTTIPSYGLELSGSRAWFKPNETGASDVALSLGRLADNNSPFYDIVTNDATGDLVIHRINRYTGAWRFKRSSPSGEQNGFLLSSHYTTGSQVGIYNTTGDAYRIHLHGEDDSYFLNDGNIGIGTDSPLAKLDIRDGSVYVPGGTFDASSLGDGSDSKTDAALVIDRGSEIYTQINGYLRTLIGSDGTEINIGQQNTSLITEINLKPGASGSVKLHDGGTGDNVKLETTGYGVTIAGGINVSGVATATDFNSASDENLKTNIHTIEDPLAKVVQIRGVNFDWKETQRPSLGVIAQEVEKVLPELVTDNGTKTVNYNGLIGLLIETVKEQQKQIDTLSERLSKLE